MHEDLTNSSTAKQEKKMKERGSVQTLATKHSFIINNIKFIDGGYYDTQTANMK